MISLYMRPESHEIDTLARRKVPIAFPVGWEHRELTGRDYGIDMVVEIFEQGVPTGNNLSLQIKGTTKTIDNETKYLKFDMPVNTLKYAEMFNSPVLLIVCPVNDKDGKNYFLWLQEYIKVVLNYENPNWRVNKSTVRVLIPIKNNIWENEIKLKWIANYPKRNMELYQYSRIYANLIDNIHDFLRQDDVFEEEFSGEEYYRKSKQNAKETLLIILDNIRALKKLDSIFKETYWSYAQFVLEHIIIPAEISALKLWENKSNDIVCDKDIICSLSSLRVLLETANSDAHSNMLWKVEGIHSF